jgi:hypothetical protein
LAAARPTLLFSDWKNAARLKPNTLSKMWPFGFKVWGLV